jgi:hypothetical protein
MNKFGLTPTYFIITFLGYIVMTSVYAIFLRENLKNNKTYAFILGSALILYGYALLAYEYYEVWQIANNNEYRLHIDKKHEKKETIKNAEQTEFQFIEIELIKQQFFKGHFVLCLFHTLSFMLPINEHLKTTDITAVLGHFMVYNDIYLIFGYVLLLAYYVLYLIRSYEEARKYFVNKLQVLGSGMLIYHYIQDIAYMLTL